VISSRERNPGSGKSGRLYTCLKNATTHLEVTPVHNRMDIMGIECDLETTVLNPVKKHRKPLHL